MADSTGQPQPSDAQGQGSQSAPLPLNAGTVLPPPPPGNMPNAGDSADMIEKVMGELLDRVQAQTDFPVDKPGTKPSTSMTYSVAAQLSVAVRLGWKLFDNFELTDVRLSLAVTKTTHAGAAMMIALEAKMMIGDVQVNLKGKIPRLEDGKDIDFILTIEAEHALQSIPLDSFLSQTSSGAVEFFSVKGAIEPSIADQLFLLRPGGFVSSASLIITRLAATKTYQVKSFEARILGGFDWDIITDKFKLRQASLAVVAQRETPAHGLNWTLGLTASLLVKDATNVNLAGEFVIIDGACTGMSAKVTIGPLRGVTLSALLDAVAGDGSSREARKNYEAPPSLYVPVDSSSPPLVLAATLNKSPTGWSLSTAEATLFLSDLAWSPLKGITLESLLFSLMVSRTPLAFESPQLDPAIAASSQSPMPLGSAGPGEIVYTAYVQGILQFLGIPLTAEVVYTSKDKNLTIKASVADNTICSLRSLCSNFSEKIAPSPTKARNPKYDIKPIADGAIVPNGCPVYPSWGLQGNFASQRQCTVVVNDSNLTRVSFTATYQGPQFTWQLSQGLSILNAGVFFDVSFQQPASIDDPSILAFVYGTLALAKGTTLFGFVACNKTSDRTKFGVLLTIHRQPDAGLGMSPKDVMDDKSLVGQPIDTSGWVLPTTVPQDSSLEKTAASFDATVTASFVREAAPGSTTVLTAVGTSLRGSGSWQVMDGVQLKDFALGIIGKRETPNPTAPFQLFASLYGRTAVDFAGTQFDVWCLAELDRKDHASDFSATVTVCTAGTAKEPPESSQLNPAQLTRLALLGAFELAVTPEHQTPDGCPAKFETLINSFAASCQIHVTRNSDVEGWVLSDINFRLQANGKWEVLPARLTMNMASLTVAVFAPRDAAKRTIEAKLSVSMTIGVSTLLDAVLGFAQAQGRTIMLGDLSTTSIPAVNMAQMTKELVPQQSDGTVPAGSTNFDLTTSRIRFWLDAAQPTMVLAGATKSGSLLYFLHRPDVQKEEYIWLLSMSITNVLQVFPWIDSSITGAFSLIDVGIEMINGALKVSQLVNYLTLAEGSGSADSRPQQVAAPLALLRTLDQGTDLDAGAWIFASVNLKGSGSMADTLALAASPNATPQITLYGYIRADVKVMDCALHLSNFKILGDSLTLSGTVIYRPSVPSIAGNATLTLVDLSSTTKPQLLASVSMSKEQTEISAMIDSGQTVDIENPFDTMYNTGFFVAAVKAKFFKAQKGGQPPRSTVTVSGSLRLGSEGSKWVITARVIFVNGKARVGVGSIGITDTNAISDNLLQPAAGVQSTPNAILWPTNFPVFQFQSASIYYARSITPNEPPLVVDGVTYHFRYCISATLNLFGAPFVITVWLPENKSGLNIQGSYQKAIDLVFAQFCSYEYNGKTLPWPSVAINTTDNRQIINTDAQAGKKVYTAKTGIMLFGIKGYEIGLTYEYKDNKGRLRGYIQYQGTILGVPNPTIYVAYEDDYLYIDHWDFKKAGEDDKKDYLQDAIRQASKVYGCDKCKDLVKLVLDKSIKTGFDFSLGKPSSGHNPVNGKTYVGTIKWSYVVIVTIPVVGDNEIGRLQMEDIDITIDQGFTSDSIGVALLKLIRDQIVNIGVALLKDPVKLAKLIALMNMKGVAADILSSLLCRDVNEDNVKDEAKDNINKNKEEPNNQSETVEKAFETVAEAVSFAGAVAGFAEGVAALGSYLGLGLLFGAGSSLAAHLLPFLTDTGDMRMVQQVMETYARLLDKSNKTQADTTKYLCMTAKPSAAPALSWVSDTPTEASILVNWADALPKPPSNAPSDYFGNFKDFTWQVTYGFLNDPNAPGLTLRDPTVDKSCTITNPAFLQQRAIYVWVRTIFALNGQSTRSDWSPNEQPLTHVLWLPAPKGISVAITNAPAYDQVTINIADPKKTNYLVALAENEQGTKSPAYETNVKDGSATITASVLGFLLRNGEQGPLKGFIREISSDSAQWRDSPWTASDTGLQVVQEKLDFTAKQVGISDALLEWNSAGSSPAAFAYVVTKQDGTVITPTVVSTIPGIRIQTQLKSPDFAAGASVTFAVRRIPTAQNILLVFMKQTISFRMALAISNTSFFDVEEQTVQLYLTSVAPLDVGQEATVTLYGSQGSSPVKVTSRSEAFFPSRSLTKMAAVPINSPLPLTVDVSVTVNPGHETLQSPPWDFPDTVGAPLAKDFHVHFADEVLHVYWDVLNPVVLCRMDLVTADQTVLVRGKDLLDSQYAGHYSTLISGSDLDAIRKEATLLQVFCTSPKGTLKTKENIAWIPNLDSWSVPAVATNTSTMSINSSLCSMYTAKDSLGGLWWLSSDVSTIQGNLQKDTTDGWKSDSVSTKVLNSTPLPNGSSVASLSREVAHQEVFWITSNGGIEGVWRVGSNFHWPSDYPFQSAGTAATARGGSLVAVSSKYSTMDIWWLAPTGSVRNAHWKHSQGNGWRSPTTVAEQANATKEATSMLAVCVAGNAAVELFWIQTGGASGPWTIQNRRCADTDASSPTYTSQIVTDSGNPAPNSKPLAISSDTYGTMVAWITTTGAVQTAVRKPTDGANVQPAWTFAWTVTPPQTASPRSRICAGTWDPTASLPNFYWVNEDSYITAAEWDPTRTKRPVPYWASYKLKVCAGWRLVEDPFMEIAVCSGTAKSIRLFWVQGDNKVWTMWDINN